MHVHVDDDGFVRAPAGLVYRRLTNIRAWPAWWPDMIVHPARGPEEAWSLELGRGPGRLRLHAEPVNWRHDQGFVLKVSGDLEGTIEFWLEADNQAARAADHAPSLVDIGTVIHVVTSADTVGRRPVRTVKLLRRSLRRGLWAFKDLLQSEVRDVIGLER